MRQQAFFFCAAVLGLLLAATAAEAFQTYQNQIPNGANVQRNGQAWPGVGHDASGGGGSRNAFGSAFAAAGRSWTTALCNADTDGDGFTNGQELGDPNCVWTQGATPSRTTDISHPAFADSTPATLTTAAPTTAAPSTTTTTAAPVTSTTTAATVTSTPPPPQTTQATTTTTTPAPPAPTAAPATSSTVPPQPTTATSPPPPPPPATTALQTTQPAPTTTTGPATSPSSAPSTTVASTVVPPAATQLPFAAELRLSGSGWGPVLGDAANRTAAAAAVANDLAQILEVPSSNVNVTRLAIGSLIVSIVVAPTPERPAAALAAAFVQATTPADARQNVTSLLPATVAQYRAAGGTTDDVTLQSASVTSPTPLASTQAPSSGAVVPRTSMIGICVLLLSLFGVFTAW